MQFYNLFTGTMIDQPVTFSNTLTVGGNQSVSTVPLRLYGAVGQTTNLLDLYADKNQAQPGFGFNALGKFAWGPGGTAPQDTFLSRIATQNGHAADTPGLLITPAVEIAGNLTINAALLTTAPTNLQVLSGGANLYLGAQGTAYWAVQGGSGHLLPINNNSQDLGYTTNRLLTVFANTADVYTVGSSSATDLTFQAGGGLYWHLVSGQGHILPNSDNSYDLGNPGLRLRGLYVAGLFVTGTATLPNGSITTANLAANAASNVVGVVNQPGGGSWNTPLNTWIDTNIQITGTFIGGYGRIAWSICLNNNTVGTTTYLGIGVDGVVAATVAQHIALATNHNLVSGGEYLYNFGPGSHRISFMIFLTGGIVSTVTNTNQLLSVVDQKR